MSILFKEDWTRDGKLVAIPDLNTSNKTFIRMAALLKRMGIDNYLFHLCLYDPALQGVDPHSLNAVNDPTGQMRLRVSIEAKRNVWYYLREVVRIPASGDDPVPFQLNRGNLAMAWCFLANIDFNGTQPRQTGKTIGAITLSSWVVYVNGINMSLAMVTHSEKLVSENVKRLKDIRNSLPPYMVKKTGEDIDNKQGLDYKSLKNAYNTYIGQKDKMAANRVGRGSTAPVIHFDELAFIPNIRITFPAIMASTNRARMNAARAGMVHSNLYTTTAGDPSTDEGEYALDIITKAMPFTEKLYDCKNKADAHAMVAKNSENKLVNGTFSYLQLGLTHEWFNDTITRNNVPPDEVERDYLNNWISLAKHPIIPKDILARMNQTRMNDPTFNDIVSDFVISWYVPENLARSKDYRRKTPLILGMDSSEMIGRDFTTFVAIDPADLSVAFTFRCNDSNTTRIGILVSRLMVEFPRMVLVPERKSTGVTIIDMVIDSLRTNGENPYTRIFNRIVDNMDQKEFQHYNIHDVGLSDTIARKFLGFMTTGNTREALYKQTLHRAAKISADRVYSPVLITELSGLQANNGRIDHRAGRNDDMVIAWLLACYLVFSGKNLHVYGLSTEELMRSYDTGASKEDAAYIAAQLQLRIKLREIESQINRSSNEYMRQHFLHKKLQLEEYLDREVKMNPISVDAVKSDYANYGDIYNQTFDSGEAKRYFSPTGVMNAVLGS